MYDNLVKCTRLGVKKQKMLVNWFAKQNTPVQIDVFSEQKNQFFKLKGECQEAHIVPLAAFLLSIEHFYSLEASRNSKNKQNDLSALKKVSNFSIKKAKKEKHNEKREKLLNLWSVIQKLRAEDFSFRDISDYLRGHHRLQVSHTYINNTWKELENGN